MFGKDVTAPRRQSSPRTQSEHTLAECRQPGQAVAQVEQRCQARRPRRVAWQVSEQTVTNTEAIAFAVLMQEFELHARHVYTRWAFPLAAFARHAQCHRLGHGFGCEGVGPELTGDGQAQRVGTPAGQVLLVAGHPVGRAHDAGVGLAAGAVVVAHLDGAAEAAPLGPVECRIEWLRCVTRHVAEEPAIIHARRTHDAVRIE